MSISTDLTLPVDVEAAMPNTDLQTFELFPKLPAELQLKVWKLGMPGPRVIEVVWNDPNKSKRNKRGRKINSPCRLSKRSSASNPALLHTCHDARELILKRYRPSFQKELGRAVFVDFEQDMILFDSDLALADFFKLPMRLSSVSNRDRRFEERTEEMKSIRVLAVQDGLYTGYGGWEFRGFRKVRELVVSERLLLFVSIYEAV